MRPRYPLVGVEVREDLIVVTRLVHRKGEYHLAGQGRVELPEGVFGVALKDRQIASPDALAKAIQTAMKLAGAEGVSRISLAVPDTLARVFLLEMQEVPRSAEQARELISWRIKKSVPFDLADARIAWQNLGQGEHGQAQLLVTVVPGTGLAEMEDLLDSIGIRAGLVELASLSAFNALRLAGLLETETLGDIAVLSATRAYFSLMILRGGRLIFFRAKNYHVQGGYQGEESLRVVGRELRSSLSYYEEHLLGEGIGKLYLRVVGIDPAAILEVATQAGCDTISAVSSGKLVAELRDDGAGEVVSELLPSIGLATRRES